MRQLNTKNVEDILALTPMQEGMLFHYLKDPKSDYYFQQLCLDLAVEIDIAVFEKAWNFVVKTNEMMRTVFRWEKLNKPSQVILKEHSIQWTYIDVSGIAADEREKHAEEIKNKDRQKKFNLQDVPSSITLCKVQSPWRIAKMKNAPRCALCTVRFPIEN